jgi:hypothetical protein
MEKVIKIMCLPYLRQCAMYISLLDTKSKFARSYAKSIAIIRHKNMETLEEFSTLMDCFFINSKPSLIQIIQLSKHSNANPIMDLIILIRYL